MSLNQRAIYSPVFLFCSVLLNIVVYIEQKGLYQERRLKLHKLRNRDRFFSADNTKILINPDHCGQRSIIAQHVFEKFEKKHESCNMKYEYEYSYAYIYEY